MFDIKTILLVEDNSIIAMSTEMLLNSSGYKVEKAVTGEDAVELFNSDNEIDLILMDIDLGKGIDGTQAATEILKRKELPIIFLTGHTEKDMVDKVKNITCYGYVIKNTGQFVLLESINMALNLFRAHSDLKKSQIENSEVINGIDNAIVKFDKYGRIIYFSKGAERIFGYEASEVIGKLSIETINPEVDSDGKNHAKMMKDIFSNTALSIINQNENRTKDGQVLLMNWYNKAVFDHLGNQMYTLSIGEDISTIQQNSLQMKSANNITNAFSNSPLMMKITRLSDGKIYEVNDNFIKQTGYSGEECIGKTSVGMGLTSQGERDVRLKLLKDGRDLVKFKTEYKCKSGALIKCNYSGIVIEVEDEKQLVSIVQKI